MKKIYIAQPMRGKSMNEILGERKRLVADAAVSLQVDDVEVLDTLFMYQDKPPLRMLGRALEKMADADAVIFAPDWKQAAGCRVEHLAASEYDMRILYGKG